MPTVTENRVSNLEWITEAVYRYPETRINDRWGLYGGGIRFDSSGMARLCQIFGWIVGLSQSDATKAFAESLADDICKQLDWLADYGGKVIDKCPTFSGNMMEVEKPKYLVRLSDDGTFNGFGVRWYVARVGEEQKGIPEEKFEKEFDEKWRIMSRVRYVYSFNGGLLYHGPRAGETFSVTLGKPHLWSIHT